MALRVYRDPRKKRGHQWRIFARPKGGQGRGRIAHDDDGEPLDGGGLATEEEAMQRLSEIRPHQALQSEVRVYMQARSRRAVESLPNEPLPPARRDDPLAIAHYHGVDPLADSMPALARVQEIEQEKWTQLQAMRQVSDSPREYMEEEDAFARWTGIAEMMRAGTRPYMFAKLQAIAVQSQDSEDDLAAVLMRMDSEEQKSETDDGL